MTVMAASVWGAIVIVLVFIVVFVGTAYGLNRRGSGLDAHPGDDRPRDDEV